MIGKCAYDMVVMDCPLKSQGFLGILGWEGPNLSDIWRNVSCASTSPQPPNQAPVTARPLQDRPWGSYKLSSLSLSTPTEHPDTPLGLDKERVPRIPRLILELCSKANTLALAEHSVSVKCFSSVACRYDASVVRAQPN